MITRLSPLPARRLAIAACHALVIACLCTPAEHAHADAGAADKAAAEALFDQGLSLMRKGDFNSACTKLEQSQAIDRGIGTMLYLAECYEKAGRTASAWALFRQAASEAAANGETDRAQTARNRSQKIEPELSKLTIAAPEPAIAGLSVTRDGTSMSNGILGVAVPVDPGDHTIEAHAPGYTDWSGSVHVGPKGDAQTLTIPQLTAAPQLAPAPAPALAVGAAVPTSEALPPSAASTQSAPSAALTTSDSHRGSTQRIVGIVTGAVGVVALGVGTVFGVSAIGKNNDAEKHCAGSVCSDQQGVSLTHDAQSAARLANVFVIGGAVLAATGVVLYFTAPSSEERSLAFGTDGRGLRLTFGGAL